ncbi:MAG: HDIG domain-containing metalloprotein [Vampirovibrionales bacterium]
MVTLSFSSDGSLMSSGHQARLLEALETLETMVWFKPLSERLSRYALVGGWIRDVLLGVPFEPDASWDIDMMVSGTWDAARLVEEAPHLAQVCEEAYLAHPETQSYRVTPVILDPTWGIIRLVVHKVASGVSCSKMTHKDEGDQASESVTLSEALLVQDTSSPTAYPPATLCYIDLAVCQGHTFEDDLHRRDLSVNAMAVVCDHDHDSPHPTRGWAWQDPCHGYQDLCTHTLRGLSAKNFQEDPLRILRVARFLATLPTDTSLQVPWRVDPQTRAWLHQFAPTMAHPAGERVQVELCKLLSATHCRAAMALLADTGVLEVLFPCMTPMRFIPPNTHHHLPLWEHTLELLFQSDTLLPQLPSWWQERLFASVTPFANGLCLVRLAALFHDVGKPNTWEVKEDGRHTFYGHDHVSATIFQTQVVPRLKLAHKLKTPIFQLIKFHLYPCQLSETSTPKALTRFYTKMGEWTPLMVFLGMIDTASTRGEARPEGVHTQDMASLTWLAQHWYAQQALLSQPLLLSGHEVMTLCHIPPSKQVGVLLQALKEAQVTLPLNSKEEAMAWMLAYASHTVPCHDDEVR